MKLHKDKRIFEQAVEATAEYYEMPTGIIEKDYYVTLLLKAIAQAEPCLVFKGGTSLSKCYKVIKRFSEDLDLTLLDTSQAQRVRLTHDIIDICKKEELTIINEAEILSKKRFNRYVIDYKPEYTISSLNPHVIVETAFMQKSFPVEEKNAASLIYDFMTDRGFIDMIDGYELNPFKVHTQSLSRTLIDKIFAICDYYLDGRIERCSRHLYDIKKIAEKVSIDDELRCLAREVREERAKNPINKSAFGGIDVNKLLERIITERVYEADYENVTRYLLYEQVGYDEAISGLKTVLQRSIFDTAK